MEPTNNSFTKATDIQTKTIQTPPHSPSPEPQKKLEVSFVAGGKTFFIKKGFNDISLGKEIDAVRAKVMGHLSAFTFNKIQDHEFKQIAGDTHFFATGSKEKGAGKTSIRHHEAIHSKGSEGTFEKGYETLLVQKIHNQGVKVLLGTELNSPDPLLIRCFSESMEYLMNRVSDLIESGFSEDKKKEITNEDLFHLYLNVFDIPIINPQFKKNIDSFISNLKKLFEYDSTAPPDSDSERSEATTPTKLDDPSTEITNAIREDDPLHYINLPDTNHRALSPPLTGSERSQADTPSTEITDTPEKNNAFQPIDPDEVPPLPDQPPPTDLPVFVVDEETPSIEKDDDAKSDVSSDPGDLEFAAEEEVDEFLNSNDDDDTINSHKGSYNVEEAEDDADIEHLVQDFRDFDLYAKNKKKIFDLEASEGVVTRVLTDIKNKAIKEFEPIIEIIVEEKIPQLKKFLENNEDETLNNFETYFKNALQEIKNIDVSKMTVLDLNKKIENIEDSLFKEEEKLIVFTQNIYLENAVNQLVEINERATFQKKYTSLNQRWQDLQKEKNSLEAKLNSQNYKIPSILSDREFFNSLETKSFPLYRTILSNTRQVKNLPLDDLENLFQEDANNLEELEKELRSLDEKINSNKIEEKTLPLAETIAFESANLSIDIPSLYLRLSNLQVSAKNASKDFLSTNIQNIISELKNKRILENNKIKARILVDENNNITFFGKKRSIQSFEKDITILKNFYTSFNSNYLNNSTYENLDLVNNLLIDYVDLEEKLGEVNKKELENLNKLYSFVLSLGKFKKNQPLEELQQTIATTRSEVENNVNKDLIEAYLNKMEELFAAIQNESRA